MLFWTKTGTFSISKWLGSDRFQLFLAQYLWSKLAFSIKNESLKWPIWDPEWHILDPKWPFWLKFLECCKRSLQGNHRKSSYPTEDSKIWSKQSSNSYWWYSHIELPNCWRRPRTKYCLVQGRYETRKSRWWRDHVFGPKTDTTVWLISMTHFSVQFASKSEFQIFRSENYRYQFIGMTILRKIRLFNFGFKFAPKIGTFDESTYNF